MRPLDESGYDVKVGGIDRIDAAAPPEQRHRQGVELARALVERFPERCARARIVPYLNHTRLPDDGALVEAPAEIALAAPALDRLPVRNPQSLHRFGSDDW